MSDEQLASEAKADALLGYIKTAAVQEITSEKRGYSLANTLSYHCWRRAQDSHTLERDGCNCFPFSILKLEFYVPQIFDRDGPA
jgi:hypothetical protein